MRTFSLLCLLLFAAPSTASAAPILFAFSGTVQSVGGGGAPIGISASIGDPIHGTLRFESTTADSEPSPGSGVYTGALLAVDLMLDGQAITLLPDTSEIRVDPGAAFIDTVFFLSGSALLGVDPLPIAFFELDATAGLLDDALPLGPPPAGSSVLALALATFSGGLDLTASIQTITAVPEPGSSLLVAVGVAFLGMRRRAPRC